MASKPRTNSDALRVFADSILDRAPCESGGVNSIDIRGDTIYHYGSHYPMARIERKLPRLKRGETRRYNSRNDGPVIAVYVNSTEWRGASRWGSSTWQVKSELTGYIEQAARTLGIPVHKIPLTGDGPVLVENVDGDDIPVIPELDIPVCPLKNPPRDPGPEPVKPEHGCIAGTTFEAEYSSDDLVFGGATTALIEDQAYTLGGYSAPQPGDFFVPRENQRDGYSLARRAGVERIYYSEHSYQRHGDGRPSGFTHKQCPHCAAFDDVHRRWQAIMDGWSYMSPYQMGYKRYVALLAEHGSVEAWRKARKDLMALRKARKAELADWLTRNSMAFDDVPERDAGNTRVKLIDPETGRVARDVYEKAIKDAATAKRRARRAALKRQREYKIEQAEREIRMAKEAEERAIRMAELRERLDAGETVDDRCLEWIAQHDIPLVERDGLQCAVLYKRLGPNMDATMGRRTFIYTVGEWAIADDYEPTPNCGHGLHFAESIAGTSYSYGPVLIECHVPIASIILMGYKVKAERCFVTRVISNDNNNEDN